MAGETLWVHVLALPARLDAHAAQGAVWGVWVADISHPWAAFPLHSYFPTITTVGLGFWTSKPTACEDQKLAARSNNPASCFQPGRGTARVGAGAARVGAERGGGGCATEGGSAAQR